MYNDTKNLSTSPHSWPLRVVAAEIANRLDYNACYEEYVASMFSMQYITPKSHEELLNMIIVMDLSRFKQEINDCFEASFHCDASIDWAQED